MPAARAEGAAGQAGPHPAGLAFGPLDVHRLTQGAKIRDQGELDAALLALRSQPLGGHGAIADHASDALITAAWLRSAAHANEMAARLAAAVEGVDGVEIV